MLFYQLSRFLTFYPSVYIFWFLTVQPAMALYTLRRAMARGVCVPWTHRRSVVIRKAQMIMSAPNVALEFTKWLQTRGCGCHRFLLGLDSTWRKTSTMYLRLSQAPAGCSTQLNGHAWIRIRTRTSSAVGWSTCTNPVGTQCLCESRHQLLLHFLNFYHSYSSWINRAQSPRYNSTFHTQTCRLTNIQ